MNTECVRRYLRAAAELLPVDLAVDVKSLEQSIGNGLPLRIAIASLAEKASIVESMGEPGRYAQSDYAQINKSVPLMYQALYELVVARMGRSYLGGNDGL